MSTLLKDAIVDAQSLREAALKSAETTVIDKYATEVRETLNQLLEQDELGGLDALGAPAGGGLDALGTTGAEDPMATADPIATPGIEDAGSGEEVADNIPLAATNGLSENEGENLNGLPKTGEDVEVDINLDALQEAVQELQDEQEFELNEQTLKALLSEEADDVSGETAGEESAEMEDADVKATDALEGDDEGSVDEALEISDELIDDIVERLTVDMGATLSGWAGRSSESMKWEMEKALAHRRSTDVEEELEIQKKAQEELVFENKQLKESLEQYKQATQELREGLHEVNLSNARLLYTNRVLRNTSLNERQKTKIVDAISKAGSVTEAKTIYKTLESTVESTPNRGPQSLSEALGRNRGTSVIRASRKESTPSDPIADRMKKLAGIK